MLRLMSHTLAKARTGRQIPSLVASLALALSLAACDQNAPLVVRTFDDALRAVIEMHDLPAPDDGRTPAGGGCPVPPGRRVGEIRYSGDDDICPPYTSALSQRNRSESREVIRRFRALSPADQQAVIDFLKQI